MAMRNGSRIAGGLRVNQLPHKCISIGLTRNFVYPLNYLHISSLMHAIAEE
jgi:hypothetical protein